MEEETKPKILVVDDEEDLCEILKFNLETQGYDVTTAYSGEEALEKDAASFNLILLDVMMGGMNGFDVAHRLRANEETRNTPIIFLTAKGTENDKIMGFNAGADDYISKPFSIREVLLRIKAVLRRSHQPKAEQKERHQLVFNKLIIDLDRKTVSVEGPDGAKRKVDVEVKYVAFWSEKYERRARKERQASIDKARRLVANPGAYTAAAHFGAAKYVRGLSVDGRTGELLEAATALEFDDGRLAADEACDGSYCIVTSETDMGDDAVIEAYRGLWKIEESFKVTKSDLETRPVYVSRQEHIEAHFLTCYVALCILRVIQALTGGKYSAGTIAEELAAMCGTNLDGNWWVFDHRSDATDDLCRMAGIDLTRQNMQLKDIKAVLAQANRWNPSPNKK